MLVRSRRAAAPVSNSASTTIRPLTMWRPPAKRSIEATSALRQQVFVTWVLDSSALTCAVIAVGPGHLGEVQAGAVRRDRVLEVGQPVADAVAVGEHRVDAQVRSMLHEGR